MNTGLFALAHLDASPLPSADIFALGLAAASGPLENVRARVEDADQPDAASSFDDGDGCCFFLGDLEDARAAAATLACRETPAAIALAAVRKWGPRTSDWLKGQWSLFCRPGAGGPWWLGTSRLLRDRVYFAFDGRRLAISGDLTRFSAVSWIGMHFDPQGVAYGVSTGDVRRRSAGRTLFSRINQVEAGCFHSFSSDGTHVAYPHGADVAFEWKGSFDEAVAMAEERLRQVVRGMLSRHERVAIFMSGGLDSAVIARFVAEERRPGQEVIALTAVAPPGCPKEDERVLASDVAEAFGIGHRLIWPHDAARIYSPRPAHFADAELSLSPRHYLYEALFDAARDFGATAVFDGAAGEASVSRSEEIDTGRMRARDQLRWGRDVARRWRHGPLVAARVFQVKLAPMLLDGLPQGFAATAPPAMPRLMPQATDVPMGWPSNHHKQWRTPTSVSGGRIRKLRPLRDRELVAMVAAMPAATTWRDGRDRALARAMLKGHVPERVQLQPKGLAFSVDYDDRLQTEAPLVLDRLPVWRQTGVDQWLDLDWLEAEIRRVGDTPFRHVGQRFLVQLTAIAAEYFHAWRHCGLG